MNNELDYLKRLAGLSTNEGSDEGNDEAQRFQSFHKVSAGDDTVPFAILYFFYKKWRGESASAKNHFGTQLNKYLKRTRTTRKGKDVRGYKINKATTTLELNNEATTWKLINEENKKTTPKARKK